MCGIRPRCRRETLPVSSSVPQSTDSALLIRVRSFDDNAWRQLVELYAPLVYEWCRRAGLQPSDSADVGQDVFRSVAASIGSFHRNEGAGSFRRWLRTITRTKIVDLVRKRQHQPREFAATLDWLEYDSPSSEHSSIETGEHVRLIRRALALIRPDFEEKTWQAFWRSAVDGDSAEEISADLKISANSIRQAKFRVLKRLREELGDIIE